MNKEENKYILYRHIRPDKDEVFYIGIGNFGREIDFKWGRNKYWKSIFNINNQNIIVDILFDNLTWEEACEKEKELITFYGRKDLDLGTLCNLTNGGEEAKGRKKISEAGKRPCSEQKKEAIRLKNIGHTTNENQKRGLDRTGCIPSNAIKILNTITNKKYNSLKEASVDFGKSIQTLKRYIENNKIIDKEYIYI